MKKILFTLAALAMIMVSCTQDNLGIELEDNRTFTISATMPKADDDAQTRVSLTPDAETGTYGLTLKWEEDDKLMLCFEHGEDYYHNNASIVPSSISSDGKSAQFTITVPKEIPVDATFCLYGVYQKTNTKNETNGGYFKEGTKTYELENREEQYVTLDKVGSTGTGITRPMLYFSQANIVNSSNPAFAPFNLKHSGWMMALHFKNSTATEIDMPLIIKLDNTSGTKWAWNGFHGDNAIYFNVATQEFSYSPTVQERERTLWFNINEYNWLPLYGQKLAAGESIVVYRWVASLLDVPELEGEVYIDQNIKEKKTPTNISTKTVTNGKIYHVYSEWDGTDFKFVPAYNFDKKVTNSTELEDALVDENISEIIVDGTIGGENDHTAYNVNRPVIIKGVGSLATRATEDTKAKVFGTFIVKSNDVIIDNLAIENKGDLTGESSINRGGIYVFANKVTITNNTITNGLGENDGLSNAIQIMSPTANNPLSNYVIKSNTLTGHIQGVTKWASSGIVIAQGYKPGSIGEEVLAITATEDDYKRLLEDNTFENNKIDVTHQDWSKPSDEVVIYPVNEAYAVVKTPEELNNALSNTAVTEIAVKGTLGSEEAYTIYTVNKTLTIKGADGAEVYGSFIVQANDVILDGLTIYAKPGGDDSVVLEGVKGTIIKNSIFDCQTKSSDSFIENKRAIEMKTNTSDVTIDNCTFKDGYYLAIQGRADNVTVKNSTIENCKSGINLQAGKNLVVENTNISVVAREESNNTYCVRFASATTNSGENMSVTGGIFSVDKGTLTATEGKYHSAIIVRAGATGALTVSGATINGEFVDLTEGMNLGAILTVNTFPENYAVVGDKITIIEEGMVYNQTTGIIFDNISDAIEKAETGNTIIVGPGNYEEDFEINKEGITLKSITDREKTKIKGKITIIADAVTVEGFSINPPKTENHNMVLPAVEKITIKDCSFDAGLEKNNFLNKNAISMSSVSGKRCDGITIDNCTFKNGYYLAINGYADNLTVESSTISNCHSGINLQGGNDLKITETDISVAVQNQDKNTYCVRFANNTNSSKNMTISSGSSSVLKVENEEKKEEREGLHRAIIIRSKAEGEFIIEGLEIYGEVIDFSKQVKLGNIIDKNKFPDFGPKINEDTESEYNEIISGK